MFLARLTADERRALLALAERIAMSDGSVTAHEVDGLIALRREAGEVGERAPARGDVAALAEAFGTPVARRVALLALLGIALADLHLHEQEARIIEELRGLFGVSVDELEALRRWVLRDLALREEAETLLRGGA